MTINNKYVYSHYRNINEINLQMYNIKNNDTRESDILAKRCLRSTFQPH